MAGIVAIEKMPIKDFAFLKNLELISYLRCRSYRRNRILHH